MHGVTMKFKLYLGFFFSIQQPFKCKNDQARESYDEI